jgi:hypothetical protein
MRQARIDQSPDREGGVARYLPEANHRVLARANLFGKDAMLARWHALRAYLIST